MPDSLLASPDSLLRAAPADEPDGAIAERAFTDVRLTRGNIYNNVLKTARALEPVSDGRYTLKLSNPRYIDPEKFTRAQQKEAILTGGTLGRRLKGTWELSDETGAVLDRRDQVVARVPFMTHRGTFIHNGSEYMLRNQQRLRSGIYAVKKENGELVNHVNILSGEGVGHHYSLDPEKGLFHINIKQAHIPLLPLLHALGATDSEVRSAWGNDLYAANYAKANDSSALNKLAARILRKTELEGDENTVRERLVKAFTSMKVDPEVTRHTLGRPFATLDKEAILAATSKLLRINRGEDRPDDRDALPYQTFLGPEDLFAERLRKDHGRMRKQLLRKIALTGNLAKMPAGALTPQLEHALLYSGLGNCFDAETLVLTRRGFVPWPEITERDEFACQIGGNLVYAKPYRLFKAQHDGILLGCRTKRFSYLVTPNHRLLCKAKCHGNYREEFASDAHGKWRHFQTSLPPMPGRDDDFTLPAAANERWGRQIVEICLPGDAWAEFLGWYIAEGWVNREPAKDGDWKYTRVNISQSREINPDKCDMIARVLARLPFRWRYNDKNTTFVIDNKQLATELAKYGRGSRNIRIPRYCFEWSNRRLRLLADAYLAGDGNIHDGHIKAETTSAGLALDLAELFGRLAGTGRISKRLLSKRNPNWRDSYVISFGTTTETTAASTAACRRHNKPVSYYELQYSGFVYCASVPGEMLYVMRDGKPHWSLNSVDETNPSELFDKLSSVTRMGEGAIGSEDAIPASAREVHGSQLGYIDLVRTPESLRSGVDLYFAQSAHKSPDGGIRAPFIDVRTGKTTLKSPREIQDLTIAFPDSFKWPGKRVPVLKGGEITYAARGEVDLQQPSFEAGFSPLANLVPLKSAVKAQRVAMGSRMLSQSLPLANPEAPLVRGALPGSKGARSFEEEYGSRMGAVFAEKAGRVMDVRDGTMKLQFNDGTTDDVELYSTFPYNRKTFLHQTPLVKMGDSFAQGQPLVRSNYTDDRGVTALGLNARTAYWPYKGYVYEDAIAVSESMAKRLTSEHLYQHELEITPKTRAGKNPFIEIFPAKFDKKTLSKLDEKGVIKVGEEVEYGQPLILAAVERDRAANKIHKKRQGGFHDQSVLWEHHDRGVVTDVAWGKNGPVVAVKSASAAQIGDKLSDRHGSKGVISRVIPDAQMPHDKDGNPFEVLMSPTSVVSRSNPAQIVETALGKLAVLEGKPVKVPDFEDIDDLTEWAHRQLRQKGISPSEDLYWPERGGMKVPNVLTGTRFFMKLQHQAEGKEQARDSGDYSMDDTPSKGGKTGKSKRLAIMDTNALLSHGALATLRDAHQIRGARNEDYWLQMMRGVTPRDPDVPLVYEKFINTLKAAGINVVRQGHQSQFMALTNKDVEHLAGDRRLTNAETVNFDDMTPVKGGLFDASMGGHSGNAWSAISLEEPMVNPVMEEPVRRILGLTKKQFEGVLTGDHELPRFGTGASAVAKALDAVDVKREMALARMQIQSGRQTLRDQAVRKLAYLKDADRLGLHPRDWVLGKAPVLPPRFRPISVLGSSQIPLVADPNLLYKELFAANENLKEMKKEVGEGGAGHERLALYNAFKAVTGLGDPTHPKLVEKNVRGLLAGVFGKGSPKFSTAQRKLLSSTVDQVGRGVILPNPDYDMDTIGIPEDGAFDVYKRYIVRRLHRRGLPITHALRHVADRSDLAREMLLQEMSERPVLVNRAPVLHKFGIMAFKPQLVKGHAIQLSPLVYKGFGADNDGDTMQYHVMSSDESRKEALERLLPSKNLFAVSDFKTPMHAAGQEYVAGVYAGTAPGLVSKRPPRIFRSKADALAAYASHQIAVNDRVEILED